MKNKLIILGGDEDNNKIKSTFERAKVSDVILIIGSLSEKFTSEAMVLNCSIEPKDDIGLAHKFNIFWSENSDLINYSHLNNTYYFGVASLLNILDYINLIISQYSISIIELLGYHDKKYIPLYATSWGESSKAAFINVSEFINPFIIDAFSDKVKIESSKPKLISFIRFTARIFSITTLTTLRQLVKVRLRNKKNNKEINIKYLCVIRSKHQLSNFKNIFSKVQGDCLILESEMLSSNELLRQINKTNLNYTSLFDGPSAVLILFKSYIVCLFKLLTLCLNKKKIVIERKDYSLCIPYQSIAIDTYIQPALVSYEKLLEKKIKSLDNKPERLISFEQVSPQAFIESKVANKLNIPSVGIKTTLIQPIAIPLIGPFDKFLVNTGVELDDAKANSVARDDHIKFEGNVKNTRLFERFRSKKVTKLNCILYASQPHLIEDNLTIIDSLLDTVSGSNINIKIRPHPRDKTLYDKYNNEPCITISYDEELASLILDSDLLISRTSTVLEESIYLGTPFISCCLSDKDRSYNARYINKQSILYCEEIDILKSRVNDYMNIKKYFNIFRKDYLVGYKEFSVIDSMQIRL